MAATYPPGPLPITKRSKFILVVFKFYANLRVYNNQNELGFILFSKIRPDSQDLPPPEPHSGGADPWIDLYSLHVQQADP